jgi:hypothetical protein
MKTLIALLIVSASTLALASDFCDGFEEGYKLVKGDSAWVPYCPYEPWIHYGSTPRKEGIKAGIKAAQQ